MKSSKNIKFKQIVQTIIVCLIINLALIACSPKNSVEQETEAVLEPEKTQTVFTEIVNDKYQSSDALRLYLKKRDNYNPLNTFDYTGRAANTLLYRSLFTLDSGNVLRTDLVDDAKFIPEKNIYEINLIKGVAFSNDQLIKAEDCKASILTYSKNLAAFLQSLSKQYVEEKSDAENLDTKTEILVSEQKDQEMISRSLLEYELKTLENIDEIKVKDDYSFEISLKDHEMGTELDVNDGSLTENISLYHDPGLPFILTMPILRADDVEHSGFADVTSGRYRIVQQEDDHISLSASDQQYPLQKIDLKIYDNSVAAMRALEDNQLDAVYLTEDDYNLYDKQNSRQMISFPGQRYFYISFGNGAAISDQANKTALQEIWQVRDDIPKMISGYQAISRLPFQFDDAVISDLNLLESKADISLNRREIQNFRNKNIRFTLITPNSTTEKEWALTLRESLLSLNIQVEIVEIAAEEYSNALAEKRYDLAINWVDIPYPMSIDQTFSLIEPGLFVDLSPEDEVLEKQIEQYFYSLNRQFDSKMMDENIFKYRDFIQQYFNKLNILGIGFEQVGIVFSNRVEGIPKSIITNPYAELEDVWVWR